MSSAWTTFVVRYRAALRAHLRQADERHLQRAYDLGRRALRQGCGVLDVVRLHQEALSGIRGLAHTSAGGAAVETRAAADTFFWEALSPFEAAHRGFREAFDRLRHLHATSGRRNRVLAAINARLKQEIATREEAQAELAKRERQLAEAQRLAGLGSFEWDLDTGTLHWSRELYRIYGFDSKTRKPSLGNYLLRVHPEDRLRARRALQAAMRNRVPFSFDERIIRPGGAMRTLHTHGEVIVDTGAAQGAARLVGFSQDITDRRQAEDMWKRYETIVNIARDFLTLIDRRYRHEAVNDAYCEAHRLKRSQILGRALAQVWGRGPFCAVLKPHLDRCFAGREVHYQCWFKVGGQRRRYYDISHYPYRQGGQVTHVIVVTRDITEHKQAQDALEESKEHYVQLFREAQAMEENLRQLSHQVVSAQEEERKHISRELHDEVGQALTAVNVSIATIRKAASEDPRILEHVDAAQRLLEQSMETVHRFARGLRPEMLDHLGPYAALRSHAKSFEARTGIKTELQPGVTLDALDAQQAIVLYRVAQESLTNVAKHARATRVQIRFPRITGGICMEIADNGRAFSVNDQLAGKGRRRLGLIGMQERVRLVNGTFAIDSSPGAGTTVRVKLPLRSATKLNGDKRSRDGSAARAPTTKKTNLEP